MSATFSALSVLPQATHTMPASAISWAHASVVGAPTTANGLSSMALSASAWAAVASSGPPLASMISTRIVRP